MAKSKNPQIGEFTCGNCNETVPLRRTSSSNRSYYYVCCCGQHFMRGERGADIVLEKGVIFGPSNPVNVNGVEPVEAVPELPPEPLTELPPLPDLPPEPEPVPEAIPEPARKSSSFLDFMEGL